jgi:hypothetical protein
VIAIGKTIVATGKGPAAVHPSLSSAFQAEAYGLWSMAIFLRYLSDQYQFSSSSHKLFIHIDNKALIGRMNRYCKQGISARSINFPDSDITIPASKELKPWSAQLQHVKAIIQQKQSNTSFQKH